MADDNGGSNGSETPGGSGAGSQAEQENQTPGGSQQSPGGTQHQSTTQQKSQPGNEGPSARERELEKQLAEVRREAATHRTKLKELEDAQLSDKEKLEKRLAELQKERDDLARERLVAQAERGVTEAARKAGAKYPEAVFRLVTLDYDSEGKPTNIDSQVKAVRERYPEMFGVTGSADGGAGKGKNQVSGGMNEAIRRMAGR